MQRLKLFAQYYARIWHRNAFEPAFALSCDFPLNCNNGLQSMRVEDIIGKFRLVLGVPKIRTCQAKKVTRKFDKHRTLELHKNLLVCQNCGGYYKLNTICGTCYEKVHELTNLMKSKIMAYNPYIGERQSTNVKFDDDTRPAFDNLTADDRRNKKRIVELGIPRPTWFKPKFVDTSDRDS